METPTTEEKQAQVVMYMKVAKDGEQLVDWPMHRGLGVPGARRVTPARFKVGDPVMYEHDLDDQESGTVLATNAMVVRLDDGRVGLIEWDGGRLTYIS